MVKVFTEKQAKWGWGFFIHPDDGNPISIPSLPEPPAKPTFDGPSDKLKHTIFVPTLDSPVPESKSALWCATLAMAWQQLEKDVAKGPIQIKGEEELSRALSRMPHAGADIIAAETP